MTSTSIVASPAAFGSPTPSTMRAHLCRRVVPRPTAGFATTSRSTCRRSGAAWQPDRADQGAGRVEDPPGLWRCDPGGVRQGQERSPGGWLAGGGDHWTPPPVNGECVEDDNVVKDDD